jgi:hypothetical protein
LQNSVVRHADADDVAQLLALQLRLDEQSEFMMYEPGSAHRPLASFGRPCPTPDRRFTSSSPPAVSCWVGAPWRCRRTGVRARRAASCSVLAHNSTAIKLYQRCGFHIEGRRREALLVNGRFVDELYAGLLLDQDRPPDGP